MFHLSKFFVDDFLISLYKENDLYLQLDKALPTIYPPAKWKDFDLGGYYLKPSLVMRYTENEQLDILKKANLKEVYGSKH
jgi:DNA-directed RNA polymerase